MKFAPLKGALALPLALCAVGLSAEAHAAGRLKSSSVNPPPVVTNPTTVTGNIRHPYYRPNAAYAPGGVVIFKRPRR